MSDCGGCVSFLKIKGTFSGGICTFLDARTRSDHGHKCKDFKAPKHDRLQTKREAKKLIKTELVTSASEHWAA
ncbi:hypothetical protein [Pseudomonas serbica]|uniref:hypothetical protein n=1 Tax=Pseudomonas serbica TaxID=2965074 RepID=UPI00237BDAFC|nr:hypothetical protein [Pseudomonas serbica]